MLMEDLKKNHGCTGDLGLIYYYDLQGRRYCPDLSDKIAKEKCDVLYGYAIHHGNSTYLKSYFQQMQTCLAATWENADGSKGNISDLKYKVVSCSVGNVNVDTLLAWAKEYVRSELQKTCESDPDRSVYFLVYTRPVTINTGRACWNDPTGRGADSQLSISGSLGMTCNHIVRWCKEIDGNSCTRSQWCMVGPEPDPNVTVECPCVNGKLDCPEQVPPTTTTTTSTTTTTAPPVIEPTQEPSETPSSSVSDSPTSFPSFEPTVWSTSIPAPNFMRDGALDSGYQDGELQEVEINECDQNLRVKWLKQGKVFKIRGSKRVRRKCGLP